MNTVTQPRQENSTRLGVGFVFSLVVVVSGVVLSLLNALGQLA